MHMANGKERTPLCESSLISRYVLLFVSLRIINPTVCLYFLSNCNSVDFIVVSMRSEIVHLLSSVL